MKTGLTRALLLCLLVPAACHDSSKDSAPAAASAEPSATASASAAPPADSTAAATPAPDTEEAQNGDAYDDQDPSALTDFHASLDKTGSWVEDGTYGTVWVPSPGVVGADFVPYRTGGHWVYGDDYTWVSDYDWGWAPFHYGRWVFADGRGWAWIPGRVYAPAWVTWRVGAPGFAYVGWAPMAPTWGWRAGVVMSIGVPVVPRFSYCVTTELFAPSIAARVVVGPRVVEAEAGTRVWTEGVRHGVVVGGPPVARVGISADKVVHAPEHDPGIAKAQAFAKPSTAVAAGGHPPTKTPDKADKRPETPGAPGGGKDKPGGNPADKPGGNPADNPGGKPGGGKPNTPAPPGGGKGGGKPPGGGKHH